MASLKVVTKDSFIWSDDMDYGTYGIVLDGGYANCVIYRTHKGLYPSKSDDENFDYVIFAYEGTYIRSSSDFRCHVKPLAAGSTITITI